MCPAIHITSIPFAFQADNAANLGGVAAANFVQLAQGVQNDTSTTNPSIFINKNNASGTPNILQLQKASNNVLVIDNGGLVTLQPAANLVGGQTAVTQTLTNSDSTGGTVIGYNQTINVNNSVSVGVTNGIKITLTDNTSLLGNTNTGISVTVNGSNTSQAPTGIVALANNGEGIRGRSGGGGASTCGTTTYTAGIGTCGESLATGNSGTSTGVGVFGSSRSGNQTSFNNLVAGGAGTVGLNESTGTASSFYVGIKGLSTQTAAAAYSSTGVFGQGNAGAGANIYGGYFTLGTGGATAGAALYASNSTVAANILDLQDGNAGSGGTNISVLTVGNGGVITANSNSATGLVVNNSSSSKAVITVDTSGNQVILGTSGAIGVDGKLTFKNATGSGTAAIVLTGNPSTNYTYQLPTGTVSSNQCLQSGTVSSGNVPLTFGSCGAGGGTFATTYSTTNQASNIITYSNSGGGALIIQDASTPLSTLFTVQNNAGTFNYLQLTLATSVPHLKIFGASSTAYADIYYDASNSTAVFGASSGTTTLGSGSGPVSIDPGGTSAFTIVGHAASSITTDTSSALTITAAAASTWSTSAGLLTLQGANGVSVLSATTTTATIDSGTTGNVVVGATNTTNAKTVSVGNANSGSALTLEAGTGASAIQIGNGATDHGIQIGTGAGIETLVIGSTNSSSKTTIQGGSGDVILATSAGNAVQIGSGTSDTNVNFLQLDSDSDFSADEGTCNATTNQGAMYYNTTTNAVRGCINSNWEDIVSTGALGLQLFGVVPDSGSGSDTGDLAGVTGLTNGPCKVSEGGTTSTVSWKGCVAFSGGRKVIVSAGTATTSAGTSATVIWQHLCLTGTNSAPALSAIGAESANLSTSSMASVGAPILCLADIKVTNGSAVITGIYNTATYTTTTKQFATSNGATAPVLGSLVKTGTTNPGAVIPSSAASETKLLGVVVATTGATSTNTVNSIIAVNGPGWVKGITGTNAVGDFVLPTTTAGYVNTAATFTSTAGYGTIGIARTAWTSACATNSLGCNSAIQVNFALR
jgi:hypothetical protein